MADAGRVVIIPRGLYNENTTYERLDAVLYNGKGYIALKTVTGVTPVADGENWQIYIDNVNIDIDSLTPNFDLASERKNIFTGETLSIIFGKIKKFFSDIKDHAYKDLATSLDVTTKGTALDATVAKELNDKLKNQLADHIVKSDVPENAKFTDTTYEQATDEKLGLVKVDNALSDTSTNAIQNKVVTTKLYALEEVESALSQTVTHNMPRIVPKDITSYITDGTFYKRLNGIDGFDLFEDIYVGDYIKMSRPITCPNQDSSAATTGSQYVTIVGLDTLQGNGDTINMNYHHAVMTAGQGFGGTQHFGRHRMNSTMTTVGGYVGSEMNTSILGAVTSNGSTASDATINQQLYAEFGSHLKTTRELCSNNINASGYNRFGDNTGCSNHWIWGSYQAILMSEVEVYGSIVWSSSGYDTGTAKIQMPLFAHNRQAINNRSVWYWLKDVTSGADFCGCGGDGVADCNGASDDWGCVRPRFVIGA